MNTEERAAEIARLQRRLNAARRVLEHPDRHQTTTLESARRIVQEDGAAYIRLVAEQIGEALKPAVAAIVETFNTQIVPAFAALGDQIRAALRQAAQTEVPAPESEPDQSSTFDGLREALAASAEPKSEPHIPADLRWMLDKLGEQWYHSGRQYGTPDIAPSAARKEDDA